MTLEIRKYPRTQHIEGSRLQVGDEDLKSVKLSELAESYVVIEEKLDGANAGISFDSDGNLRLQSRGHLLTGGHRERHFNLFKAWASFHTAALWEILGSRYILYGEWLYAKHTVFYDNLPSYFLEFDVFDAANDEFLSTARRQEMLKSSPVTSVPVLQTGETPSFDEMRQLVGKSLYKTNNWLESLENQVEVGDLQLDKILKETDTSEMMEGLYLKTEKDGAVTGRYKFVRASFLTSVVDSGSHWLDRPIVPNQLASDVDPFEAKHFVRTDHDHT